MSLLILIMKEIGFVD